jgi:hypothetical protein
MHLLSLPRIDHTAAAATAHAVAGSMNGVTAELRSQALRRVRAAVRAKRLSPARAARAAALGDLGIARLFRADVLGAPPALPHFEALSPIPAREAAPVLARCRWFVELAARRGCMSSALADALTDPACNLAVIPALVVATWNNLLASYAPEWAAIETSADHRAFATIVPSALATTEPSDDLVVVQPSGLSRLFLDADAPDFVSLARSLRSLSRAMQFPVLCGDPLDGREAYAEACVPPEVWDDLRHHITWDGSSVQSVDFEGIRVMLDEFGMDPDWADDLVEAFAFKMRLKAAVGPAESAPALPPPARSDSALMVAARHIAALAARVRAMPRIRLPYYEIATYGLPLHILCSNAFDSFETYLIDMIDTECSEDMPAMRVQRGEMTASEANRVLARLVPEVLAAELAFHHAQFATGNPEGYLQLWQRRAYG